MIYSFNLKWTKFESNWDPNIRLNWTNIFRNCDNPFQMWQIMNDTSSLVWLDISFQDVSLLKPSILQNILGTVHAAVEQIEILFFLSDVRINSIFRLVFKYQVRWRCNNVHNWSNRQIIHIKCQSSRQNKHLQLKIDRRSCACKCKTFWENSTKFCILLFFYPFFQIIWLDFSIFINPNSPFGEQTWTFIAQLKSTSQVKSAYFCCCPKAANFGRFNTMSIFVQKHSKKKKIAGNISSCNLTKRVLISSVRSTIDF